MFFGFNIWKKKKPTQQFESKHGLHILFKEGESLSWRGVWFIVSSVEEESVTLIPDLKKLNSYDMSSSHYRREEALG